MTQDRPDGPARENPVRGRDDPSLAHQARISHAEIARFFDGLQLLEPGLVQVHRWQPGAAAPGNGDKIAAYAGLARMP